MKKYTSHISTRFSINGVDFCLEQGQPIELPDSDLTEDLLRRNWITVYAESEFKKKK